MRRLGLAAAAAVALGLWGAPAAAQNIPGTFELTGIGGGYFGHQIYQLPRADIGTATTYEYGARLGYNLNYGVEIEAAWTYSNPNLTATRTLPDGPSGTLGSVKTNTYELDGLFSLGDQAASFYVVVGAGATTFQPVIAGVEAGTTTEFSGSAGVGGKFWFSRNFGARVEGRWRYVTTGDTNTGFWCDSSGACYFWANNLYGHWDASAGLTLRF
ncbi:MAG TPA: outer membrane beta-barrel protein [Thermoanaerobaculia bacterium]|nr:outer membrane beta-barrel protein [Thermoanaerobaculia bacterium]